MHLTLRIPVTLIFLCALFGGCGRSNESTPATKAVHAVEEGYVDANGVLLYYRMFGSGKPLVILHGGPGASHEYFLPYLLPLARKHRLVFVDERGSGRSEKLEDPGDTPSRPWPRTSKRSDATSHSARSICSGIPSEVHSRRPTPSPTSRNSTT